MNDIYMGDIDAPEQERQDANEAEDAVLNGDVDEPAEDSADNREYEQRYDDNNYNDGGQGEGVYSSVARALMEDGIFNTLDVSGVNDASSFRDAMEAEINNRLTPLQQRVNAALNYGMQPDEIQDYESALSEAQGYTDDMVKDESDDGVELRKNLIYQACLARGMNEQQAEREVNKSFKAGTDIEDSLDARNTVIEAIKYRYDEAARERAEAQRQAQANRDGFNRALYESVAQDDGSMFGELTANTKRIVLGNMFDRSVRMEDGRMMTPIEAMAASDPIRFQKALAVAFTLTGGFRDFNKLGAVRANRAVKRGIEGLEKALRGGSGRSGGSYKYANNAASEFDNDTELLV